MYRYVSGGAILIYSNYSIASVEGNFIGNSATGTYSVRGGAVYLNSSSSITFSATTDNYSYLYNYATSNSSGIPTSASDANGGFMYIEC